MQRTCTVCRHAFQIQDGDLELLAKLSPVVGGTRFDLPPPTLCPDCRQQRRLCWRNERSLYRRTCASCKRNIIAMYGPSSPFTVYCPECWWSDTWDPLSFGRRFDFSRPFLEQFRELQVQVPRMSLNVVGNENCEFVNLGGYNKNCYLVFAMEYDEDCMYGTEIVKSLRCVDALNCFESQYCYEVTDIEKCDHLSFSQDCSTCTDSAFLADCKGCSSCLLCCNLRNKRHCVRNVQVTKEEYERERRALTDRLMRGELESIREEFAVLRANVPRRHASLTACEFVSGDYLKNSKNLHHCFDVSYGEDCAYVYTGFKVKDLLDVCHVTEGELAYEALSVGYDSHNALFTHAAWSSNSLLYCDIAQSCSYLLGCAGVKRAQYCILNQQHSREAYEELVPKIIDHMRTTGEYGEFFAPDIAPFGYNETTAIDYFPLTQAEATSKDIPWTTIVQEPLTVSKTIPTSEMPKDIADVSDDITQWAIVCEATKRPFRIIRQELDFYRSMGLPLPRLHPDERHRRRMAQRNPRKLWKRTCSHCEKPIATSYSPERPEKVLCEKCYLREVY